MDEWVNGRDSRWEESDSGGEVMAENSDKLSTEQKEMNIFS